MLSEQEKNKIKRQALKAKSMNDCPYDSNSDEFDHFERIFVQKMRKSSEDYGNYYESEFDTLKGSTQFIEKNSTYNAYKNMKDKG